MMECFILYASISLPNMLNTVFILIKLLCFTKLGPGLTRVYSESTWKKPSPPISGHATWIPS